VGVVLDGSDHVGQSCQLGEIFLGDFLVLFVLVLCLFGLALRRALLGRLSLLLLSLAFHVNQDSGGVSNEGHGIEFVRKSLMLE
jgi:hypothetical protein